MLGAAPARAQTTPAIETVDGKQIPGRVVDRVPGRYAIVERPDGTQEAVDWDRIRLLEGKPPPPVPPPGPGTLIPEGFTPDKIDKLADTGKRASDNLKGLVAPRDGTQFIGSIKDSQALLEAVGIKRGPPNVALVGAAMLGLPFCFETNYGNLNGPHAPWFGPACKYFLVPGAALGLLLAPFMTTKEKEMVGPSVHHLDLSVYALDYEKKSALTGSLNRAPQGSIFGNNLGYDVGYTYIHPRLGLIGYGHLTLQQTTIARGDFISVSNQFFKIDGQFGLDVVRLLSGGKKDSYWTQHSAFVRAGPSFFHDWIVSRDNASDSNVRYTLANPLNQSIGLVSAVGYEIAAEVDFRFPLFLGGFHFQFERGSYPSISFPSLNARDSAFVALVGFDDLRQGDTYTWQRVKAELELPIDFSRFGGVFLGGQLVRYENNVGTGVDNRGISLDYRLRFQ
jgi:hypothetical protein